MSELTAIDILLTPGDSMIERAKSVNARLLANVPSPPGFALDENHQPHITTLQRYVRTADLEAVFEAVQGVARSVDLSTLSFTAVAIKHMAIAAEPGIGLTGIVVQPGSAVLDFQSALIEALKPYTESGGTADAFVRTDAEPDINATTIGYIENYVPEHSGANYLAHVTVGLAKDDFLATVEAEAFEPLVFAPAGLSIYQLGNNGTAAKHLKSLTI